MSYEYTSSDEESVSYSDEEIARPTKQYSKDYDLHQIKTPTTERVVKDISPPAWYPLPDSEFWKENGLPNVNAIHGHLSKEGKCSKAQITELINKVYDVLCAEDNVVYVEAPVTVCGDIHGQFFDLLKLFEVGGDPHSTTYLFLGDYVDRGNFSIECVILLFSYKLVYPKNFFLLRGNHECRHLTEYFTFKEELEFKYDLDVYESVMDAFDALPLAAVMNKQFFCVHGGLSPELQTIDDINKIDRFTEPPPSGPMCDLLWADPMEDFNTESENDYVFNSVRGCSYNFSFNAACDFLEKNKLLSIIRAHEAQDAGYRMHRKNENTGFPSLITLFSAPNYLDTYNNKGAVLRYENNVINIRQFNNTVHPYYLPGFMNVFTWSIPFVAEKVGEILLSVLNLVDDAAVEVVEALNEEKEKRREALRQKVRSLSRIINLVKTMREERETTLKIGALSPNGTDIPLEVDVKKNENSLEKALQSIDGVKALDKPNEARPPGLERTMKDSLTRGSSSPDALRRKSSKETILSMKQQKDFQINHQKRMETTLSSNSPPIPTIKADTASV